MEDHLVVLDYAGVFENHPRFTCYNSECNCATLVRQPWMNNAVWNQKVDEFRQSHSFHKALSWAEYNAITQPESKPELESEPELESNQN